MRNILLLNLVCFAAATMGQEAPKWIGIEGYEPIPEHTPILDSARLYVAARDEGLEEEYLYDYEYEIEKKGGIYYVFILIRAYDEDMNPGYFPGGHFGLSIDKDGEVIDLHPGQ